MRIHQIYIDYTQSLEKKASTKLNRPLSLVEKQGIHNAGSGMMLEAVDQTIARTAKAFLSEELKTTGLSFNDRLQELKFIFHSELESLLERKLSQKELTFIENLPLWTEHLQLLIKVSSMKKDKPRDITNIR